MAMSRDFILVFSGGVVSLMTTLVVLFVMDYFYRRDQKVGAIPPAQSKIADHAPQTPAAEPAPKPKMVDQTPPVAAAIKPSAEKPAPSKSADWKPTKTVVEQPVAPPVVAPKVAPVVDEKPTPVVAPKAAPEAADGKKKTDDDQPSQPHRPDPPEKISKRKK